MAWLWRRWCLLAWAWYRVLCSFGIDTKEPPMVGLYPLNNASAPAQQPTEVSSFFSAATQIVGTTLPNFPLATPSFTTPPYAFNTSVDAEPGEIVSSGLAVSTYSPVLGTRRPNVTALAVVTPSPTLFTYILTDGSGHVVTSISTAPAPDITLGTPPGWTNGGVPVMYRIPCTFPLGLFIALVTLVVSRFIV